MENEYSNLKEEGILCPACGYPETKVKDSRKHFGKVKRVRECTKCAYKFETMEIVMQISNSFYIQKNNQELKRETIHSLKIMLNKFVKDDECLETVCEMIEKWLFESQNVNGECSEEDSKSIIVSEKELQKVIFAAISIVDINLATEYCLKTILKAGKKKGSNQIQKMSKICEETKPYVEKLASYRTNNYAKTSNQDDENNSDDND